MAFERSFDSNGSGATEYLLSRCDANNPYALKMPDTEGCPECDGDISGRDFEAQSITGGCAF